MTPASPSGVRWRRVAFATRLDPESWLRFWLVEADAGALAVRRVQGLTAYFQAEFGRITAGNAGDINHAGYAWR
jgi:hypothetical protein